MARILMLEDDYVRIAQFVDELKFHDLTVVNRAASAIELIRTQHVEVVVHSLNPGAAQAMMDVLTRAAISAHRCPWGSFSPKNLIVGG